MRRNDTDLGMPGTLYKATKANIEALAAPVEGMLAHATDTHEQGYYSGTAWVWHPDPDALDAWLAAKEASYAPASMTVTYGTLDAGAYGDLAAVGGTDVEISEAAGTNAIQLTLTFTSVTLAPNNVLIYGNYDGGSNHQIAVELLNSGTAQYDEIGRLTHSTTKRWYSFAVFSGASYVNAGTVTLRIRHLDAGNATHDLILDYVAAQKTLTTGGGAVVEHGELAGLGDDDHTQYLLRTDAREKLTAARTYYVRTDGNDSNTGLANTAGGAFLTWQKAWDTIVAGLDQSGNIATIQVGDGTYTAGINAAVAPTGPVVINGNSGTPANVVLSTTSADGVGIKCPAVVTVQNFKVQTATLGNCVLSQNGAYVVIGAGMNFGACAGAHIKASNAYAFGASSYAVSGAAVYHYFGVLGGKLEFASLTVTISGTPAFSGAFTYMDLHGLMSAYALTFSGSATGVRYGVTTNSVIQTYGGGENYFPGNSAGVKSTGGEYA